MTRQPLPHLRLGAGPPLVVLPGLSARLGSPARLARWLQHQQISELAAGRTVWSIDRRSGLTEGTTIADLASDYAATLRQLFDGPVDVVGISTGGSIALQIAADYPGLVKRLVLVSSAHRLSDQGRRTQSDTAALLRARRPRRAAARFLANTGASKIARTVLGGMAFLVPRAIVGHGDGDLLITLDAEDSFDLGDRLSAIIAPTLVAGGVRDRFYSSELFEKLSAGLPNGNLSLYNRAGHMSITGNRRLIDEILRFLPSSQHPAV